ncbi:hypothetical protein [Paenibacillus sp. L3-i20]|uniref:hypothetical protein n=1 Tax=Paenibacillus sp. L3-i20 TaxID=2905833 RepID=UPI001EE096C4|nr:hypothetical protein [Paenibacillus sp. L3-i20]GKU75964.1 hypothetical protein L3i20_v203610 [Paenibacillus sp. L3-i20]
MKLFKRILTHHILYCPMCLSELNYYAGGSKGTETFKCVNCLKYFDRQKKQRNIVETDIPNQWNELFFKNDPWHAFYHGTPTSIALKPKWLTWIDKFTKKK